MATLLWDHADVLTREFLIDSPRREKPGFGRGNGHSAGDRGLASGVDDAEVARRKQIEHKKLQRMIAYAETRLCLRATILRYFGDPAVREPCGSCRNCEPHGTLDPYDRELVGKILSGIARSGGRYGRRKIIAMLVGDTGELPPALARLSTTGLLRHEQPETIDGWIDAGVAGGLIAMSRDQYRTLSLTSHGRDVMNGRAETLRMVTPARPRHRSSWRGLREDWRPPHRRRRRFEEW